MIGQFNIGTFKFLDKEKLRTNICYNKHLTTNSLFTQLQTYVKNYQCTQISSACYAPWLTAQLLLKKISALQTLSVHLTQAIGPFIAISTC